MKLNFKKFWPVLLCAVLVLTNVISIMLWQPWSSREDGTRKITVTGESSIKSEPDEYQFSPYYQRATSSEITQLSQDLVTKLKALGIDENQIKVTVNNYGVGPQDTKTNVIPDQSQSMLSLNLSVTSKQLAQKIQDYLLTTNSQGLVSPNSVFSTSKQKKLEDQARTAAIADARKKADSSAGALGSKVGRVLQVSDGNSGGIAVPLRDSAVSSSAPSSAISSLPIQAGQNELSYSVQVTFSLR